MYLCAYSSATWVFPTPPRPCSAMGSTTAVPAPASWSRSFSRTSFRPVNAAFLVDVPHRRDGAREPGLAYCRVQRMLNGLWYVAERTEEIFPGSGRIAAGEVHHCPVTERTRERHFAHPD